VAREIFAVSPTQPLAAAGTIPDYSRSGHPRQAAGDSPVSFPSLRRERLGSAV